MSSAHTSLARYIIKNKSGNNFVTKYFIIIILYSINQYVVCNSCLASWLFISWVSCTGAGIIATVAEAVV